MFFEDWSGLWRVLVVGGLAYAGMILILRVSGKRTLSKMNAFDLVVTVALGSSLATVILSRDVALVEGLLAFALLIGLQYAVAWSAVRSKRVQRVIKAEPALVFYRGDYLDDRLRAERLTRGEVIAAVREQGIGAMNDVEAVVLETAGQLSIIRGPVGAGGSSALRGVAGAA